jgi:hypothetical protein
VCLTHIYIYVNIFKITHIYLLERDLEKDIINSLANANVKAKTVPLSAIFDLGTKESCGEGQRPEICSVNGVDSSLTMEA